MKELWQSLVARTGNDYHRMIIWIRNRTTLEFLGTWKQLYNSDLKVVEFDYFKMQARLPGFVLSPGQWIIKTSAIGMYVRSGR